MINFSVTLSLFIILLFYFIVDTTYYVTPTRYSVGRSYLVNVVNSLFNNISSGFLVILISLIFTLLVINISGNIPLINIGTLYYFFTCSISITFWCALMLVVARTQIYSFLAHILPFGSPMALSLFLPIVEIFSQMIRPFTLIIRLSTNLSSGHIILYIFSYFSLSSFMLSSVIFVFLTALFTLEICISLLQAYIFSSLTYLYISETL